MILCLHLRSSEFVLYLCPTPLPALEVPYIKIKMSWTFIRSLVAAFLDAASVNFFFRRKKSCHYHSLRIFSVLYRQQMMHCPQSERSAQTAHRVQVSDHWLSSSTHSVSEANDPSWNKHWDIQGGVGIGFPRITQKQENDFASDGRSASTVVPSCSEKPYLTSLFSTETVSENLFKDLKITRFYIKKVDVSCIFRPLVLEISTWEHTIGTNIKHDYSSSYIGPIAIYLKVDNRV